MLTQITGFRFGFGFGTVESGPVTWDSFSNTQSFAYTGSDQTWTVPAGTKNIGVMIWGAAGGSYFNGGTRTADNYTCAGSGGYTQAIVSVTGGETLIIVVGAGGAGTNGASAGYGGGGDGGYTARSAGEWGCAGGGMSGIFAGPGTVYNGNTWQPPAGPRAIAIAGGGSGYGLTGNFRSPSTSDTSTSSLNPDGFSLPGPPPLSYSRGNVWHGAGGGGLRGENGTRGQPTGPNNPYIVGPGAAPGTTTAAEGGYQTGGGRGVEASNVDGSPGTQGKGGNAADAPWEYAGGGGGGGWYGGGGGGASWPSPVYGPGGGGSGFIGNTSLTQPGPGSSESDTWSGISPHNSRNYQLAFTVISPRTTSEVFSVGFTPIYNSEVSAPYYPGTSNAGRAPVSSSSAALTGNNGYVIIRY